jgi:preprotein translocase subunit SecY
MIARIRQLFRFLFLSSDIRNRLLITILLLTIYRLAAHFPVPGIDREAVSSIFQSSGVTFINFLDLLSGGTVSNFSVLAMGVYPYITAQIILNLLTPIIPSLQARMEDDPREGRKWMEKWTYYLAVPMALLNAIGQIRLIENAVGTDILTFDLGLNLPSAATLLTMMAGTMFAIWLGELISEHGIRNQGLSLIIFAGIVSRIPSNLGQLLTVQDPTNLIITVVALVFIMVLTILAIVYVQEGRRNVPVMYPGRRVGNRMSMPVKGTLPLMVNMAGMIPLIFAQSLLTFPGILAGFFIGSETPWVQNVASWVQLNFNGEGTAWWVLFFFMVVGFTFFYTDVLFAQQNYGENLKRSGAQIPGVTKGAPTQRYLTKVLRRITLPGALFLGLVAIMPFLISLLPFWSAGNNTGLLLVSSSGLLIVVGVVRDLYRAIEAELKLRGYDSAVLVR